MGNSVRASALSGIVETIKSLGGDYQQVFADAGIDPDLLNTPDRFMSGHNVYRLLNAAARRLKRRDLGLLMGQKSDLLMIGPVFIAMRHARTGREALTLATRFIHTQNQMVEVTLVPLPGSARELLCLRNLIGTPRDLVLLKERQAVFVHRVMREVCGEDYRAIEVWFTHERQAPVEAYVGAFGIEPEFGCAETGVVFERRMLDRVRPSRSPQLAEMAEQYLRSLGEPEADAGYVDEVTSIIRILMRSSDCTSAETARALGVHERTLQRRLNAEGLSFEQLKDGVRREAAAQLMADNGVSLTQVAHILQYSNSSAFTRACRRWFGVSPSTYRKNVVRPRDPTATHATA